MNSITFGLNPNTLGMGPSLVSTPTTTSDPVSTPSLTTTSDLVSTPSSAILGPLTTAWIPPPDCSVIVGACSDCDGGWQAQTCAGAATVRDNIDCWPPRAPGVYTPIPGQQPLNTWGVYSPANVCPSGYSTACSYNGAIKSNDFIFDFQPKATETVIGCCPTGYDCYHGGHGQTCFALLTSTTIPTVTCESGTSAHFQYLTLPHAAASDIARTISTYSAYAPLFQLVDEISSTLSSDSSSSTSSLPSSPASSTGSSAAQGLSTGAKAGIGCGVAFGVILLGTAAFFLFRRRMKRNGGNSGGYDTETKTNMLPTGPAELGKGLPIELGADPAEFRIGPAELEANRGTWLPVGPGTRAAQ
ncbi:hypothetical protein GGR54DRAFT_639371 [Hypoxylon sp. NC1633]|nr:hypothetical protein GGR54DRAFT_639371 [Hypoxylon sp. NC1633]